MTSPAPTTRLEQNRRGTPGGHVVVATAIVAFVGVGLLKPWDAREPREAAGREATARAVEQVGPADAAGLPPLSWDRLDRVVRPRDDWGVRAIVARLSPGRPARDQVALGDWRLAEDWTEARLRTHYDAFEPERKSELSGGVTIESHGGIIAALGITSPLAETPLDVRAWRVRSSGVAERLPLRDLSGRRGGPERLFFAPGVASGGGDHWAPGTYRFDLLLGRRVARLTVLIAGGRTLANPGEKSGGGIPPRALRALEELPPGPFIVDEGAGAIHVPARAGERLGEVGAWLAQPRSTDPPGPVGVVAAPDVRIIGLKLAPGQRVTDARLFSMAPERAQVGRMRLGREGVESGLVEPYGAAVPSYVYFEPDSGAWPAGVYRLDLEWDGRSGHATGSWHVDIVPSPQTTVGSFLRLFQRARPYAGQPVVVGRSVPRYGVPVTTVVHRVDAGTRAGESTGGWCAGGVWFDSPQRAVAFGHPRHVAPAISVALIARDNSRAPVDLAVAAPALDGLALVAPAGGMGWLPGRYEVTLTHAQRGGLSRAVERFMLCFRSPPMTAP